MGIAVEGKKIYSIYKKIVQNRQGNVLQRKCLPEQWPKPTEKQESKNIRKKMQKQKKPDPQPNSDNPAPTWCVHTPHSSSSSSELSINTSSLWDGAAMS